jgi:hypothetical protein
MLALNFNGSGSFNEVQLCRRLLTMVKLKCRVEITVDAAPFWRWPLGFDGSQN